MAGHGSSHPPSLEHCPGTRSPPAAVEVALAGASPALQRRPAPGTTHVSACSTAWVACPIQVSNCRAVEWQRRQAACYSLRKSARLVGVIASGQRLMHEPSVHVGPSLHDLVSSMSGALTCRPLPKLSPWYTGAGRPVCPQLWSPGKPGRCAGRAALQPRSRLEGRAARSHNT